MSTEELFDTAEPLKPKKLSPLPDNPTPQSKGRFPKWLHRKLPRGHQHFKTDALLKRHKLSLVCEEAKCPNRMECYASKTATFLALGKTCTRACGFCDIDFNKTPAPPDPSEPKRIANSSKILGLKHIVVTMVSRDDLPDGGASHLVLIIRAIRESLPTSTIELLTSDFGGNLEALHVVLDERPNVFNHNIETIRSLTPRVRHKATYDRSLQVLETAKKSGKAKLIKSGMMVGLGETLSEVKETLKDLHHIGCNSVTIGQYLQANRNKLLVKRFVSPAEFEELKNFGESLGIAKMYCGPFVRSSYNAHKLL